MEMKCTYIHYDLVEKWYSHLKLYLCEFGALGLESRLNLIIDMFLS